MLSRAVLGLFLVTAAGVLRLALAVPRVPRKTPRALHKHVERVVDYNWADEFADYREHEGEPGHIFESLVALDNWTRGTTYTPRSYLMTHRTTTLLH